MLRCVATHRRWDYRTSSRSYVDENRIFQCDLFEWKSQHLSHSRTKIDLLILRSKQQFQEADCYHRRASLFSIHPPTAPQAFMCKHSSWEPNFCKKVQVLLIKLVSPIGLMCQIVQIQQGLQNLHVLFSYIIPQENAAHFLGAFDISYHTSMQ